MIDCRTYFLFYQDEKTTFFELGEAPNTRSTRRRDATKPSRVNHRLARDDMALARRGAPVRLMPGLGGVWVMRMHFIGGRPWGTAKALELATCG